MLIIDAMKQLFKYRKSYKEKPPHTVWLLDEKDNRRFTGIYGNSSWIERSYPEYRQRPFRLTGYGWVIRVTGSEKEDIYVREITFNTEQLVLSD